MPDVATQPLTSPTDTLRIAVPGAARIDQPRLNTHDPEWMDHMIDHIETLQGEGGVRETRIRLSPDALGSLDIVLSDDSDGVAVRFSADHAATRALLADAAPRLTELAEARGLRLSTSTGEGASHRQPEQHTANDRQANPQNILAVIESSDGTTDQDRIA